MTTTPPAAPVPRTGRVIHLSDLLKRPVTDSGGGSLGRVSDVVVRLRGAQHPAVKGLVATVGGREVFIPIDQTGTFDGETLKLTSAKLDLRRFERRDGEVLLRADVLGHRLIDVQTAHMIKAADLELEQRNGEWVLAGVDTHRTPRRLLRFLGLGTSQQEEHSFRDWARFEPLIGHTRSAGLRGPFVRIRGLKPAPIADLLEEASKEEEAEILGHVHADPELEADVFEELDEDRATRLLGARSDAEIAEVLARMRADDAADAIAELPQSRRQPVLDLLPPGSAHQGTDPDGLQPHERGRPDGRGLRGRARRPHRSARRSKRSAGAESLQPEALTSVHTLDERGRLRGVATLVKLVQADPAASTG